MLSFLTFLWEPALLLIIGACVSIPVFLLNIKWAPTLGLIDWPKARGLSDEQIPIIGHTMVVITLITASVLMNFYTISPWFLTTAIVMAVMGHIDDRKPLPALDKMFFQIVCVITVIFLDNNIYNAITIKYGPWGTFWGAFLIVGLVNAVNFIDGIDGLAGIVIFIGSAGAVFLSRGHTDLDGYSIMCAILCGTLIPFLYLNVAKRRGFLGNVGSYFFSYVLAMVHLSIPLEAAGPVSRMSISGLCFLIPISDATMVMLTRIFTARSPFQPDKGHLHHRLIQSSIALRYILACFGFIELMSVLIAYGITRTPGIQDSIIPTLICISHMSVTAILILLVERASKKRIQGYFQRLDNGDPIYFIKYQFTNLDGSPLTASKLRRLEARVSAEIRVSDLCFAQEPNILFVTLRTLSEPLKGISGRLDSVFHAEKVQTILVPDQGEFIKVSRSSVSESKKLKTG